MTPIVRMAAWLAAVATFSGALAADEDLDAKPAMAVAQAWLATVDSGGYAQSWEESSAVFKAATTRLQWETTVQAARAPLGPVNARKLRSVTYSRAIPGAPAGEYFVIQFDTHFLNRPLTSETVTPMREADGSWKVAGYFIR
jgi:hypothetical protein